jgi:multiple sugar transport system permease protein/putative aldouronate transport system permease protein
MNTTELKPLIHKTGIWRRRWNTRGLYLLFLIPFVYIAVFNYVPLYGILIAFKRFSPARGILGSDWVGFYNFNRFFSSPNFKNVLGNTLTLNIYGLIAGFPLPIILAIFVNHCFRTHFKKVVQTITFAPHFISAVVMVGIITQLFGLDSGGINMLLGALGFKHINFLGISSMFPHVYVWSGVWAGTGYGAILYISVLAAVDPTYHEAAIIDGANMWQRIWHIDLATIRPIIVIMLILSMGNLLGSSFEKVYLLQNPLNITSSEVISTYVYKVGVQGMEGRPDYSFGTAIGLFQNVVGLILTLAVNKISNLLTGEGMF